MRRNVFGLLTLIAALGLTLAVSCQRDHALRILGINDGQPVMSDIVDFGLIIERIEDEVDTTQIAVIPDDIVTVDIQYVEIGLGLPTWTPYTAQINKITVDYVDAGVIPGEVVQYSSTTLPADITVQSDVDVKKFTTAEFTIAPSLWKEYHFGDEAQDEWNEDEYGVVAHLSARVTVEAVDLASNKEVEAEAETEIIIGNFWDDPDRLGQ